MGNCDANGQLSSENAVIECDLAFAIKGTEGMDGAKPLLSLWLAQPMLTGEAARNAFPMLTLGSSELFDGYKLAFGEYNIDLANASSLLDKNHKIRVQWDIMRGRGTVYFDQQPVLRDIPLLPLNNQTFSPCLTLRTGEGVSALRLDDIQVNLLQNETLDSGKSYLTATVSGEDDDASGLPTPLLFDDFESYKQKGNIASGGWSASFVQSDMDLQAGSGLSDHSERKASLAIDSQTPISGMFSGKAAIPAGTVLTLTKPISWPERMPFAVSAKPFAIVRSAKSETEIEKDSLIHPEKDTHNQAYEENYDQNLRGPHTAIPATTTPLSGRTTLYGTTYYIHSYDGKLLAEYDAIGTCVKDYIYMGNKLIAEYQPVIAKYYYYSSDQINSTRIITDSTGTVVYSALFDPYGGMQKQWVNTYSPTLKFSGKERESKSELDYFGARYYDHMRYRFISVDPMINKDEALVNPQLWNLYAYCGNNPVTNYDQDGRKFDCRWFASMTELNLIKSYLNQDPRARAIIHEAETMNETIVLVESPMQSLYKDGTIWFDPYAGNRIDTGEIQSPALMFLHEVAHAIDKFKDPAGHNARQEYDEQYRRKEERRVITTIETPVANKLGEPTRKNHRGTPIRVTDPTFHRKNNETN